MTTDVARSRRAQHRVDERVRNRVAIGVTGKARVIRNTHTAQDELPTVLKAM